MRRTLKQRELQALDLRTYNMDIGPQQQQQHEKVES